MRQQNLLKKAEVDKAKELEKTKQAMNQAIADPASNPEQVKNVIDSQNQGHEEKNKILRDEVIKLNAAMAKAKQDNLKVVDNFKNEYLAIIKEFANNEVQCEITSSDPKAMLLEKTDDQVKKKKPRAVTLVIYININ